MYRKYLKYLHSDAIKKEMDRRDEIRKDQLVLDRAEVQAKKDIERVKNLEKKSLIREEISREIKRKEKERIRKLKLRALKREKKIREIEERKKQRLKEIVANSRIKSERVRQKRLMLVQKSRKKLVNILWKRIKKDCRRKKLRREREAREEEFKQKITLDK
ncbi:hypothetical protein KQX54_007461 [Cotesia glomerata]|uniref:Uncharacterized protein n=2 Tax=Cotesia glomerata TaxID=32391 RepID=A0AAV7HZZ8_COTGL|nr:hypothetical protein KQX54_007461 [Cotesia glomerata]